MIGVLAVMAILASLLLPNLMRRIAEAGAAREDRNLAALEEGLAAYVRRFQTVPGAASWATNVAAMTALNLNEILRVNPNDAASARVYLIHPGFSPSSGGNPILTNTAAGTFAPTNARILLVSTTKSSLTLPVASGIAADTAPNRGAFENVWDWHYNPGTKAPPAGWPAAWNDHGEHLHVQRINLAPLFHRVTFSNTRFPTNVPFAKFGALATVAFNATNAVEAFYLHGTDLRLYKHDSPYAGPPANPDDLDLVHTVEKDANFLYTGSPPQWIMP
jgi:type II secretory pathway pseudopilin PulG